MFEDAVEPDTLIVNSRIATHSKILPLALIAEDQDEYEASVSISVDRRGSSGECFIHFPTVLRYLFWLNSFAKFLL